MAAPPQPSPQQMQQMQAQFAAEAAKRGMTPQQFQQLQQQQITAEAAKRGMPVEQYVAELKANIMKQHQAQQQQQQAQAQGSGQNHGNQPHVHGQGQSQPQQIAIKPGSPPAPEALAVAKFLRSQDLKPRTCIYNGDRKDMFKGTSRKPYPHLSHP
jgi:translocation protein SEC62